MSARWSVSTRGRGIAYLVMIVVVAFMAGFLIRGPGERPESVETAGTGAHSHDGEEEPSLWTCSMHPQIQLPAPGKCPICFMDLIPVEAGAGSGEGERQLRMTEAAVKLAEIRTAPAVRRHVEAPIRLPGTVAYDETRVAGITARVAGRVDRLYANFTGFEVDRGDRIASLYSPALLSAQEELIQARKAADRMSSDPDPVLGRTVEATLKAARRKLELFGFSAGQIEEIESSGSAEDHLVLNAPIGGTVIEKNIVEGEYVKTGTMLLRIADISVVWVMLDAYQSDIQMIAKGQVVEFATKSLPGEVFKGKVDFVDPFLDEKTRTASVRVEAPNPGGRLKPGMFVSGIVMAGIDAGGNAGSAIILSGSEAPLVIPAGAPLLTGTRAVVYVRIPGDGDPVFEGREVRLGPRAGDYYVVRSGIEEGEMVVVNGAFKIDSEMQIRARTSMMSPEEGTASSGGIHEDRPGGKVSGEGYRELEPVYDSYFEMQMALAGDDLEKAAAASVKLAEAVRAVDMSIFDAEGRGPWVKVSREISGAASEGAGAGDIEVCRRSFDRISRAVIEMHSTFGHTGGSPYFLTFCPMAEGGGGAFWLQEVDTVYNSHYGAAMLRCGEIRERLDPRD